MLTPTEKTDVMCLPRFSSTTRTNAADLMPSDTIGADRMCMSDLRKDVPFQNTVLITWLFEAACAANAFLMPGVFSAMRGWQDRGTCGLAC